METGPLHTGPLHTGTAPLLPPPRAQPTARDAALRRSAQALEANFLAEMLKSAGFGKSRDAMGGGIGEEQFSSFFVTEQARQMVKAGGIGLTEQLFHALKARDGNGG